MQYCLLCSLYYRYDLVDTEFENENSQKKNSRKSAENVGRQKLLVTQQKFGHYLPNLFNDKVIHLLHSASICLHSIESLAIAFFNLNEK